MRSVVTVSSVVVAGAGGTGQPGRRRWACAGVVVGHVGGLWSAAVGAWLVSGATREAVVDGGVSAVVRSRVVAELGWDPRVDSADITVWVDEGVVTVRGTVGSLRQVREVSRAVRRLYGVTCVRNRLMVRPTGAGLGCDGGGGRCGGSGPDAA